MATFSSQGTILKVKVGTTFQNVGQVRQISGPSLQAESIDVTDISKTWKEYIVGSIDGGEVSLELLLDPSDAQHVVLRSAMVAREKRDFEIEWTQTAVAPDPAKKVSFSGYVTGFEFNAALDEALSANVTIKVTGEVTFA